MPDPTPEVLAQACRAQGHVLSAHMADARRPMCAECAALALTEQAQAKIDVIHSDEEMRLRAQITKQAQEITRLEDLVARQRQTIDELGDGLNALVHARTEQAHPECHPAALCDGPEQARELSTAKRVLKDICEDAMGQDCEETCGYAHDEECRVYSVLNEARYRTKQLEALTAESAKQAQEIERVTRQDTAWAAVEVFSAEIDALDTVEKTELFEKIRARAAAQGGADAQPR